MSRLDLEKMPNLFVKQRLPRMIDRFNRRSVLSSTKLTQRSVVRTLREKPDFLSVAVPVRQAELHDEIET